MDDVRGLLNEAVASSGPAAPLRALRWAAALSAPVVRQATSNADDGDLSAIEAVILLDDALTQLSDMLGAVHSLLSAANPGPDVEAYLRDREAELTQAAEQIDTTKATLASLRGREDALRQRQAELADLRRDLAELRRLEQLVTALDELNEQRDVITQRLAALQARTDNTERAIATDAGELHRLTEARRALLAQDAREMLERAAAAHQQLAAEERKAAQDRATLETTSRRHAELVAERDQRLAAIAAHAAADRSVAAALAAVPGFDDQRPALEQVRSITDDVQGRLRELDDALRRVLDDRDEPGAEGRIQLSWRDTPSG